MSKKASRKPVTRELLAKVLQELGVKKSAALLDSIAARGERDFSFQLWRAVIKALDDGAPDSLASKGVAARKARASEVEMLSCMIASLCSRKSRRGRAVYVQKHWPDGDGPACPSLRTIQKYIP